MAFIGGKTNRNILNSPPSKYLPSEVIPKRGQDALTAQLVPLDSDLWKVENYRQFLEYRRKMIAANINSFMRNLDVPLTSKS